MKYKEDQNRHNCLRVQPQFNSLLFFFFFFFFFFLCFVFQPISITFRQSHKLVRRPSCKYQSCVSLLSFWSIFCRMFSSVKQTNSLLSTKIDVCSQVRKCVNVPHFASEMCNLLKEAGNFESVSVLICKILFESRNLFTASQLTSLNSTLSQYISNNQEYIENNNNMYFTQ